MWFEDWMRESRCRIGGGSLWSVAQIEVVPARQSGEGRLAQLGTKLERRSWWMEYEHERICRAVGTRRKWWCCI